MTLTRTLTALSSLTAVLVLVPVPTATAQSSLRRVEAAAGDVVPTRLLVQLKGGSRSAALQELLKRSRILRHQRVRRLNLHIIDTTATEAAALVATLRNDPQIKAVEFDRRIAPALIANDPQYSSAYHLEMMGCPIAWDMTTGSASVPIAILDSGVDPTHPDLVGKLVAGYNAFENTTDTADVTGHGTMVAGVAAAASHNGIGVTGVAWQNPIMPVRVTDLSGFAYVSTLTAGLVWAADHGARVANISFAVFGANALATAAQYFVNNGGVVFAAAGNDGAAHAESNNPWILSVAATDGGDHRATWSSVGPYVDLAAPGVGIPTTARGGGYAWASGTSFASPLAAGVAGLLLGINPSLSATQIADLLGGNAVDLGDPGYDELYGWGRVSAVDAVAAAQVATVGPDTTAPLANITAPTDGAPVLNIATITAIAIDNTAVTRVELFVDGAFLGSDRTAPYTFAWDVRALAAGPHTLHAVAYDVSGNQGTSVAVVARVIDLEGPTVRLLAPTAGSTLRPTAPLTLAATATDNAGVAYVDFYVDGRLVGSDTDAPYGLSVALPSLSAGYVNVYARAVDTAGNTATSAVARVAVSVPLADRRRPTIRITAPRSRTTYLGPEVVTVTASALDNVGVVRVDFYVDKQLYRSTTAAPYATTIDLSTLLRGNHYVIARAVDAAGNVGTSASVRLYKSF